jgi:hypothetical protein
LHAAFNKPNLPEPGKFASAASIKDGTLPLRRLCRSKSSEKLNSLRANLLRSWSEKSKGYLEQILDCNGPLPDGS